MSGGQRPPNVSVQEFSCEEWSSGAALYCGVDFGSREGPLCVVSIKAMNRRAFWQRLRLARKWEGVLLGVAWERMHWG